MNEKSVRVEVARHYDLIIDEIDDPAHPVTDPFYDEGWMREWLEQADGPAFFQALGDVRGQAVLEIGVGTGRVARKVLELGCAHLTGIDISAKTLQRARRNLAGWPNVELVLCDAEEFRRESAFDAAYCVWAFFHIADQRRDGEYRRLAEARRPPGALAGDGGRVAGLRAAPDPAVPGCTGASGRVAGSIGLLHRSLFMTDLRRRRKRQYYTPW